MNNQIQQWNLNAELAIYQSQSHRFASEYLTMLDDLNPSYGDALRFQLGSVHMNEMVWTNALSYEQWSRFYQFMSDAQLPPVKASHIRGWEEFVEYVYFEPEPLTIEVPLEGHYNNFEIIQYQPVTNERYIYFPLQDQYCKIHVLHESKYLNYENISPMYQQARFVRRRQFIYSNSQDVDIIYEFRLIWIGANITEIQSTQPICECVIHTLPNWKTVDRILLLLSCLEKIMDILGRPLDATPFVVTPRQGHYHDLKRLCENIQERFFFVNQKEQEEKQDGQQQQQPVGEITECKINEEISISIENS